MTNDKKIIEEKLKFLRNYATMNNVPILRLQTSQLLKQKIEEYQPKEILEIGTAVGYSGILMLSHCDGNLTTIEADEEVSKIAQKNFEDVNLSDRKTILVGDCINYLPSLVKSGKEYDFIFLDGPKGQYIKYLPYLLKMLKIGGLMFSDNVLYRGMVNNKVPTPKKKRTLVKNLRLFLEELDKDDNIEHQLLDLEDGVSLCSKRG